MDKRSEKSFVGNGAGGGEPAPRGSILPMIVARTGNVHRRKGAGRGGPGRVVTIAGAEKTRRFGAELAIVAHKSNGALRAYGRSLKTRRTVQSPE